jgi:glycerophosphoryl diester phosphodiesterase
MSAPKPPMPLIVAHRGAVEHHPENSLAAFHKAFELGVGAIEFDVHPTRDGELVLIHDPYLERTTNLKGVVAEHRAAELRAALSPKGGLAIPTLGEVLDLATGAAGELHLEIKTDISAEPYKGFVPKIVEAVESRGLLSRTIFTCFVPSVLTEVRQHAPEARVLGSVNRTSAEGMGGLSAAITGFLAVPDCLLAIEKTLLSYNFDDVRARIDLAALGVWTVDTEPEFAFWRNKGVRQITTNRPELALSYAANAG